jgi:hypothetical protein
MQKEKNARVELSPAQSNPSLARPEDFVVVEDDLPGHGQCGNNQREYRKLLAVNASNSTDAEEHPNVNTAKKPHTP